MTTEIPNIDAEVADIENLITDLYKDIKTDITSSIKKGLKTLKSEEILYKRNVIDLQEYLSRFTLSELDTIVVEDKLETFLDREFPYVQKDEELFNLLLDIKYDTFDIGIFDILRGVSIDTVKNKSANTIDNIYTNLLNAGVLKIKSDRHKELLKDGRVYTCRILRKEGNCTIIADDVKRVAFTYDGVVSPPRTIKASVLEGVIQEYLKDNSTDIKLVLKLYKQVLKDFNKFTKRLSDEEFTNVKTMLKVLEYHLEDIVDTVIHFRSIRHDFIITTLDTIAIHQPGVIANRL
jgi:hypothetical protein